MSVRVSATPRQFAVLLYPAAMLGVFFVIPFAIMLATSFYLRTEGTFYEPAFEFDNYIRLFTAFFGNVLGFSLFAAAFAAVISVVVAFSFTYQLTRLRRRHQVPILVFILAVLSLSEVIIGFSWSTLLSRTAGLSNLLVWLGLMQQAVSWSPGLTALLIGLVYLGFPYTVLVLYPTLSRLDPELTEASRMLGASPLRSFFSIVVPALRNPILGALIMVFVFTLGAYLLPQVLGRPQHWTLSVLITDQAIFQSNIPFSAALAIFLMLISLALVGITLMIGREQEIGR